MRSRARSPASCTRLTGVARVGHRLRRGSDRAAPAHEPAPARCGDGRRNRCWPNRATSTTCATVSASAPRPPSPHARPKVLRGADCVTFPGGADSRIGARAPAACRPIRRWHDDGDSVALTRACRSRRSACAVHPRGVRRLLRLALADKRKQARKQLPVQPKTALLYAAIESAAPRGGQSSIGDRLRADLVDGAFDALAAERTGRHPRCRTRSPRAATPSARSCSPRRCSACARPRRSSPLVAEVRARLDSQADRLGQRQPRRHARATAALTPPGFLRDVPAAALARIPALPEGAGAARRARAARSGARPGADAGTQAVRRCAGAWPGASDRRRPEWQALRWDLEELRVSLFAQELGARGGVSAKKLAGRLAQLS